MSYPDPRYHGTTGEASASYRPAGHAPELTYPSGNSAHYLATGASTGGTYGLYRWVMGPEPSGPGPHFHRTITESFYVLRTDPHLRRAGVAGGRATRPRPRPPRPAAPTPRHVTHRPAAFPL